MFTSVQISKIYAEASFHFYICYPIWAIDVLKLTFKTTNPSGLQSSNRFNYRVMVQLADIPESTIAGFCLFLLKEKSFEGVIETVLNPYLQNRYSYGKNQCVCSFVKMNSCCFEPPVF